MTTPSWDYRQPPEPDPAHTGRGPVGEPLGYNLGDVRYEQPPTLLQPSGGYAPAPLSTSQATAGFVVSLVGLVSMSFLNVIASPAIIVGLVLSAIALKRCRQGLAGGRGFAIAGLVLGILGVLLTALMLVFIVSMMAWGF